LSILTHQLLKLLIVGGVLGQHLDLIWGHIAGEGPAVFPALQIVIGAIWALANDTEFARLHVLDLGDLLQNLSGIEVFHGASIYICIYYTTKKEGFRAIFPIGVLRPSQTSRTSQTCPTRLPIIALLL